MISRQEYLREIRSALRRSRIVALIGPRQCGKTTLAREVVTPHSQNYFDLEDPTSITQLDEPMTALGNLKGIVVIDEVQRRPELFPVLRVLADRKPLTARFLILGSASPELLRQSSESLAGRLETIMLSGFNLAEVGKRQQARLWQRGGFPLSYVARTDNDSFAWRKSFIQTFLERDMPQLGFNIPATTLLRFWTILAHYHGQIWNAAEPARSLGISETSVRRYLDILTDVFMIRQMQPWHANLKKRQVKAPKIFFRDTGLLHHLLGIRTEKELLTHPKSGSSWEGLAIEEALRAFHPEEAFYWATHAGAEIDIVMQRNNTLYGVECKRVDAPRMTPSIRTALDELGLEKILIVYPGSRAYSLADRVKAIPLSALAEASIQKEFRK
jgi:hypothetical protein